MSIPTPRLGFSAVYWSFRYTGIPLKKGRIAWNFGKTNNPFCTVYTGKNGMKYSYTVGTPTSLPAIIVIAGQSR